MSSSVVCRLLRALRPPPTLLSPSPCRAAAPSSLLGTVRCRLRRESVFPWAGKSLDSSPWGADLFPLLLFILSILTEHSLCAGYSARSFPDINSLNPHNNPVGWVLAGPLYR